MNVAVMLQAYADDLAAGVNPQFVASRLRNFAAMIEANPPNPYAAGRTDRREGSDRRADTPTSPAPPAA